MLVRHAARAVGGLLLVSLLALAVGCGPDYRARAVVKGKVTMNNKKTTLPTGTVTFYGPNNIVSSAAIQPDGSYEMRDAPIGDVKIGVSVPKAPPGGFGKLQNTPALKDKAKEEKPADASEKRIPIMGAAPPSIVRIDDRFADPEKSGLTYTVTKGEQPHDIDLP